MKKLLNSVGIPLLLSLTFLAVLFLIYISYFSRQSTEATLDISASRPLSETTSPDSVITPTEVLPTLTLVPSSTLTPTLSLKPTKDIRATENVTTTPSVLAASTILTSNSPPDSGYRLQTVDTGSGKFTVNIIAADSSNTKVVVDTASADNCTKDCPALPLKDYVTRNNAFAAINGSYFCPSTYPSCVDKKNSFDLLLMNKNKKYFNSDNNVYSQNPGVVFGGSYVRFLRKVSEWGRDTNIDGMISNFPLLVFNRENIFGGSSDSKLTARGPRGFVANKGNRVFIGIVKNATVAESAKVLLTLGMDNAMNLDSGGSTALWYKGYKAGPGRAIPNAILFVAK